MNNKFTLLDIVQTFYLTGYRDMTDMCHQNFFGKELRNRSLI